MIVGCDYRRQCLNTWSQESWSPCSLHSCHAGGCGGCFLGDVAVSLKNTVISAGIPCRLVNRGQQYLYFQGQAVPGNTIQFLIFLDCWSQVKALPYLQTSVTNACYHSVQNLLSSSLLSKKLKIMIYRSVILPVVLYGCETWSHIEGGT